MKVGDDDVTPLVVAAVALITLSVAGSSSFPVAPLYLILTVQLHSSSNDDPPKPLIAIYITNKYILHRQK